MKFIFLLFSSNFNQNSFRILTFLSIVIKFCIDLITYLKNLALYNQSNSFEICFQ